MSQEEESKVGKVIALPDKLLGLANCGNFVTEMCQDPDVIKAAVVFMSKGEGVMVKCTTDVKRSELSLFANVMGNLSLTYSNDPEPGEEEEE